MSFWGLPILLEAPPQGQAIHQRVDFDLFGNQLVCHRTTGGGKVTAGHAPTSRNTVDGKSVPVPHWGVVLDLPEWRALAERLTAARVDFLIEPQVRFEGQAGEQGTFFIADPSGNAIEFKGFADPGQLFAV